MKKKARLTGKSLVTELPRSRQRNPLYKINKGGLAAVTGKHKVVIVSSAKMTPLKSEVRVAQKQKTIIDDRAAQREKIPAVAMLFRGFEQVLHLFNDTVFEYGMHETDRETAMHAIEPTHLYEFMMKYDPFRLKLFLARFPQLAYKIYRGVPAANALLMLMVDKNLLVYRNARYMKTVQCVKVIGPLFDDATINTVASAETLRRRALRADRQWQHTKETLEAVFEELTNNGFSARDNLQTLTELHERSIELGAPATHTALLHEESQHYRKVAREGDQTIEDAEYDDQPKGKSKRYAKEAIEGDTGPRRAGGHRTAMPLVQRPAKPLRSKMVTQAAAVLAADDAKTRKRVQRRADLLGYIKHVRCEDPSTYRLMGTDTLDARFGHEYDAQCISERRHGKKDAKRKNDELVEKAATPMLDDEHANVFRGMKA